MHNINVSKFKKKVKKKRQMYALLEEKLLNQTLFISTQVAVILIYLKQMILQNHLTQSK